MRAVASILRALADQLDPPKVVVTYTGSPARRTWQAIPTGTATTGGIKTNYREAS